MNVGINNINFKRSDMPKKVEASSAESVKEKQTKPEEKAKVSGSLAAAIYGIKTVQTKPSDNIKDFVNNLSFAEELSPEDKRSITSVLKKDDEETPYMQKMIELINQGKVTSRGITKLCQHGVMSDMVKGDIDTYFDKVVSQGMDVKDAFVPEFQSQKEAEEASAVGDVFRVAGQDRIFVKNDDEASVQLKMDADKFLELYPPVERFTACQGGNGDCYLLSAINSIMENPYSRATIYGCFEQNGNDIEVTIPESYSSTTFKNGQLPKNADMDKYSSGPLGMKLLEHTFGLDLESELYGNYTYTVESKIKEMEEKLAKMQEENAPDEKSTAKREKLEQKIQNWKAAQVKVDEAMMDPNHSLAFVLDDCGDFVIGKSGPMTKDVSKIDSDYKFPGNYYTGGNGGFIDEAMQRFGYDAEYLEVEDEEETIDEALFAESPNDYIITAATHPEEEGEMETPQEESYSIYSSHAYKVSPFDDKNGKRKFKVTNPWNEAHTVIMTVNKLKQFFASFGIAEVK